MPGLSQSSSSYSSWAEGRGPKGPFSLGDPLLGSVLSLLQVFILERLVGKIFDLAFMPAMNGESGDVGDKPLWGT
jgi:hypothetical protein